MDNDNWSERLGILINRINAKSITDKEAIEEFSIILPKMNAILKARIDNQEQRLIDLEKVNGELQELGIAEMLAHRFIEQKGLYDEFQLFASGELLKTIDEFAKPLIN